MTQLTYDEYAPRTEVVDEHYGLWIDGEQDKLIRYPLFVGIKPGEKVDTYYSNEVLTAPSEPGEYELWHYALGGTHYRWEFIKAS